MENILTKLNEIEKNIYETFDESIKFSNGAEEFNSAKLISLQNKNINNLYKYFNILDESDNFMVIDELGRINQLVLWGMFSFTYYYQFGDFEYLEMLFKAPDFVKLIDIHMMASNFLKKYNKKATEDESDFMFLMDSFHFIVFIETKIQTEEVPFDNFMKMILEHIAKWSKTPAIFNYLIFASAKIIGKYEIESIKIENEVIIPIFMTFSKHQDKSFPMAKQHFKNIINEYINFFTIFGKTPNKSSLWHYTTTNALEKILLSHSLRMGRTKDLNDLDEGDYLFPKKEQKGELISLGLKPDSNALWGNYTNFQGVQLEFYKNQIERNFSRLLTSPGGGAYDLKKVEISQVYYGAENKKGFIHHFENIKRILKKVFPSCHLIIDKAFESAKDHWRWFFKKDGWSYEAEHRIILKEEFGKDIRTQLDKGSTPVNFILDDSIFYIKFNKKSLKSITLAPYLKLNSIYKDGLRVWLDSNGYSHVKINESDLNIQKL